VEATVTRPDGVRIRYRVAGDGVPVLAVHGLGSSGRTFGPMASWLSPTHRVLTPDLRGYGDSDDVPAASGWSTFAGDLAAVLDHAGIPCAHVVAASAGTLSALHLCNAHAGRVASLTLIGPTLGDAADPGLARRRLGERARALEEVQEGAARRAARMAGPAADDAALALLRSEHARIRPAGYGVVAELLMQTDAEPLLRGLPAPVQVVVGEADAVTGPPVAERVRQLTAAEVVTLPRVGHSPQVERPHETADILRSFTGR
jgi:pimeloyl-ACP methyl ester carboxylesterase